MHFERVGPVAQARRRGADRGDPAARISDVRKAVVTVKDGLVYRPSELYGELGVKP
jgi:hypothetical protein